MKKGDSKSKKVLSVSVTELAEYLDGITTTHVQRLERKGIVKKIAKGVYDLRASVQNYICYLKKNQLETGQDSYDSQRTRLYRARADKAEIEAAALKGQVHDAQCVADIMNDSISSARARLLALPTVAAPRVADITDANECVSILTVLITDALSELTKYNGRAVTTLYLKQQSEIEKEEDDENNNN